MAKWEGETAVVAATKSFHSGHNRKAGLAYKFFNLGGYSLLIRDIVARLNMYCSSSPPIGGVSDELPLKEFCHSATQVPLITYLCMPCSLPASPTQSSGTMARKHR